MNTEQQSRPTLEILSTGRQYGEYQVVSGYLYAPTLKRVVLKNGVQLSIQASESHYCSPRNSEGPWCEVEVGVFGTTRPIKSFGSRWETQRKGRYAEKRWYLYPWCSMQAVMAYINRIGIAEEQEVGG